jgi:glyoxylase-like metal-dependent hydrolase (beta-lactamase superfamily II)
VQVTGTRQREAWLAGEFPPVENVTDGLWSIPVPIPDNPLRYVLTYLIEHRSGFLMVDPGWNHPDSWTTLTAGLATAQIPLAAITAVVITHVHPDHHGLSRAVQEQSGAWIGMHEREDAWLAGLAEQGAVRAGMAAYMRLSGAPPEHLAALAARQHTVGPPSRMARADRTLTHGDLLDVPGLTVRAIWTPGHSPGHLCFHLPDRGLLLTGDHVLPRITPNVSVYNLDSSPLDDYLDSLAALRGISPAEVLPAHEYRFTDLDARLDVLAEHHQERLDEVRQALASAPDGLPAWQVALRVSWSRTWDELGPFQHQAALGEVSAHLRHLERHGRARRTEADGTALWSSLPD